MEKFCPSKLPWKVLEEDPLPTGTKFCTLEQSFCFFFLKSSLSDNEKKDLRSSVYVNSIDREHTIKKNDFTILFAST